MLVEHSLTDRNGKLVRVYVADHTSTAITFEVRDPAGNFLWDAQITPDDARRIGVEFSTFLWEHGLIDPETGKLQA